MYYSLGGSLVCGTLWYFRVFISQMQGGDQEPVLESSNFHFLYFTSITLFCLQRPSWLCKKVCQLLHSKYFPEQHLQSTKNNKVSRKQPSEAPKKLYRSFHVFTIPKKFYSSSIPHPLKNKSQFTYKFLYFT